MPPMIGGEAQRYQLLLRLNNAIISKTTREELFRTLAQELRRMVAYDRFCINLYDAGTKSLTHFAAAEGVITAGVDVAGSRPLEQGAIAQMVIRTRQPVVITDLARYTYWDSARALLGVGLQATLAYPLIIRGRVLGTLHLSFREAPDELEELEDFLRELSVQAAIAVDNMISHLELMAVNERLERQKRFLLNQGEERYQLDNFIYQSPAMVELMRQVELVASTDAAVLITGETGTGKDYLARFIHSLSPRREALLIKVNCPALAPSLFESELFGHAKGAFTGAQTRRVGRFEMADGGTIFLDEVGDLPPELQAKLLHVLQDQTFERVGESKAIRTDFRVISATNHDLEAAIVEGQFRSDLYYRLDTIRLRLPPLRERAEDIPLLVERLTKVEADRSHCRPPRYEAGAVDLLQAYPWPGNVRELKNLVKRMVILRPGEPIAAADLDKFLASGRSGQEPGLPSLAEVERRHIEAALARCGGAVGGAGGAAKALGLPRTTLQYRMRKYGLRGAPTKTPPRS